MEQKILKNRKPNWTDNEMKALSEAVAENCSILFGKLNMNLTSDKKKHAWDAISKRVNAVSVVCDRSIDECKERWNDAKAAVKKKESQRRKYSKGTGGGPSEEDTFKSWELDVLGCIPAESIIGLDGAVDTAWAQEEVVLCTKSSNDEQTEQIKCDEEGATADCDATVVIESAASKRNCDETTTFCPEKKTNKKIKYNATDVDQFKEEILSMKRRKLILEEAKLKLEERKVAALEGILHIISSSDQYSVAPIIPLFDGSNV